MINILFSGNEKVYDGVLSEMLSIFFRSSVSEPFCFYLFTMEITRVKPEYTAISDAQVLFLDRLSKKYHSENRVVKVDVGELYEREFAHCKNEMAYCSPYTLLRLLADLVPGIPDKLLYLDVDLLFNRDIHLLYDIDITDYEYAAARDHYGKYLLNPNYINAGVLLLNMKKIKETGLFTRARELLREKKLTFADQSAIYRCTTKKKMLPQKFNDQKFLHKSTIIRHFSKRLFYLPYPHTANIKQWKVSEIHRIFGYYVFDDILYEYLYLKRRFIETEE